MIAQALFGAESALLKAECELEQLLDSLYGRWPYEWRAFEYHRRSRSLDVYGVIPSEAARDTLRRVGFARVIEHDHDQHKFSECACRTEGAAP